MGYEAYITRIKNLEPVPNADKLQKGQCFGNQIVVDLSYEDGELGIYFPSDGKLGIEFAEANNLLRKKDENGKNIGGFIDPKKRNIKAIKLRGEISDGLFLKLESLSQFTDISKLKEGDKITVLNGITICEKYIPEIRAKSSSGSGSGIKKGRAKAKYPLFEEHLDTKQLAYCLSEFKPGDICTITLKMHGTSGRTAYTINEEKKHSLLRKIGRRPQKTIKKWDFVSGSRRVVLNFDNSSPQNNGFRQHWHDEIAPKLNKGEEIFYEIVGYSDDNTLIMPEGSNKKVDEEFVREYGNTTKFTYGCEPEQSDVYVYRMTKADEDGNVVEYPDWFVRYRCEQMALKCVPKFEDFIFTTEEDLLERTHKYYDGPDPVGKSHIREGVVVRIQNRPTFKAYKEKNFSFKCIEGIIKESSKAPDIEEMQEIDLSNIEEMQN